MEPITTGACAALAEAFAYPARGRLDALAGAVTAMPEGAARKAYAAFVDGVRGLPLGGWEELYTRTFDLNPPAAPYVGYQAWGDSYQRGAFLARLRRAQLAAGMDSRGELPDHLAPVLRYLERTREPLPELLEVLGPALQRMQAALRKAEPGNPYAGLLEAARLVCLDLVREGA